MSVRTATIDANAEESFDNMMRDRTIGRFVFLDVGRGKLIIASTFRCLGSILPNPTKKTRNYITALPNSHLSLFKFNPTSLITFKTLETYRK